MTYFLNRTRSIGFLFLLLNANIFFGAESKQQTGVLAEGTPWETPYFMNDTQLAGPTVLIVGGMHGNEPAGYAPQNRSGIGRLRTGDWL